MMLAALAVVEWAGALTHLSTLRAAGEDHDVLIDVLVGELDEHVQTWNELQSLKGAPTTTDWAQTEAACRAFLTEHADEVNAVLQREEVGRDGPTERQPQE